MININIHENKQDLVLVDAKSIWNAPDGTVWQQYFNGKPQKWYFINIGVHEPLLIVWYDSESEQYRLSSNSRKDLLEYDSLVTFAKINVDLKLDLIFRK